MTKTPALRADYRDLLAAIMARIGEARLRAAVSVNRDLILLYWEIGRDIRARQEQEGFGTAVIKRRAADFRRNSPDMTGFSQRNLKYMRAFAETWPDRRLCNCSLYNFPGA